MLLFTAAAPEGHNIVNAGSYFDLLLDFSAT